MEIRKFLIGIITKFVFFVLIINIYPTVSSVLLNFSLGLGMGTASKTLVKLTSEVTAYMAKLEQIAAKDEEEAQKEAADLDAALVSVTALEKQQEEELDGHGILNSLSRVKTNIDLSDAQAKADRAQKIVDARLKNPSRAQKTIAAIRSVLRPLDANGKETSVNLANSYRWDLRLKDKSGSDTNFLSPNALLRISLLGAQIMWENEWSSVNAEWAGIDEPDETEDSTETVYTTKSTKKLSMFKFPVHRLFDMALCFICCIAIILATVFSLLQYVMAILEWTIVVSFAVVLLPCILFDGLKDIANKVLPSLLAQAVKLTFITMCMFFAAYCFIGLAMDEIGEGAFGWETFAYVIFIIFLAYALTQSAPKLAVTLLSGQPQLSMGELVAAMGTAAAGGAGVARAAQYAQYGLDKTRGGLAAAARAGMNRVGDAAAVAGAGSSAYSNSKAGGAARVLAGLDGGIREAGHRTKMHFNSSLAGAAHYGMKGGGMGSGSGTGENRFEHTSDNLMPETQIHYGKAGKIDSVTGKAKAMTAKEYLAAQFSSGQTNDINRRKDPPIPEPHKVPKYSDYPQNSSYEPEPEKKK